MTLTITRMSRPEAAEYLAWQYLKPAANIAEADWPGRLDDIFADNGEDYYSAYAGDDFIGVFAYAFPGGELAFNQKLAPVSDVAPAAFVQAGIDFARARYHYRGRITTRVGADARALFAALGFQAGEAAAGEVLMTLE